MSHTKRLAFVFLVIVTSFCLRCQSSRYVEIYDDDFGESAGHNCDTATALAEMKAEIQSLQQLVVGLRQKLDPDFKLPPSSQSNCPAGFQYVSLARSCYKVIYEQHNWTSADQKCRDLHPGAHLVAITGRDENIGLKAYLRQIAATTSFWTSGQRQNETSCTDEFVWKISNSTELPLSFTNWHRGEPNCHGNSLEGCLELNLDFGHQWNDIPCHSVTSPFCEYDPSST